MKPILLATKRKVFYWSVLAVGVIVIACIGYRILCRHLALQISDVGYSFTPGEVLLLDSHTFRGTIVHLTNSRTEYAHVVLVSEGGQNPLLIHADPQQGCIAETLADYLTGNLVLGLAVLRPSASDKQIVEALNFAKEAVDKKTPFNLSFHYCNGNGLYCTELVLQAYSHAGMPLLSNIRQGEIIRPERLLASRYLSLAFEVNAGMDCVHKSAFLPMDFEASSK